MAFRIFSPLAVQLDNQGAPVAGGELRFYSAGTTTPKVVYGDIDLTVNLGSTITLNAAGRPADDAELWGDGSYFVELYDADGVKLDESDNVEVPGGSAATLPALGVDEFITSDGANLVATTIRQAPDPTGQSGKYLSTDGEIYLFVDPPTDPVIPEPDIEVTATTFRAGDGATSKLIQTGSSSASASGSRNTIASVTFPTPFVTLEHVSVTQVHNGVTADSHVPNQCNTVESTTGFTVRFSTDENSSSTVWNITSPVPFKWMAVGTIATPA